MSPISTGRLPRTCYGGHWIYVLMGFVCGFAAMGILMVYTTDVDTPVALEPKCETIIIHRDWR